MIRWTAEADTPTPTPIPTPTSTDGRNRAEETNKSIKQPRYVDEYELYGFHNFTVLDNLIKQNL
jgi:hypothetical protein